MIDCIQLGKGIWQFVDIEHDYNQNILLYYVKILTDKK